MRSISPSTSAASVSPVRTCPIAALQSRSASSAVSAPSSRIHPSRLRKKRSPGPPNMSVSEANPSAASQMNGVRTGPIWSPPPARFPRG